LKITLNEFVTDISVTVWQVDQATPDIEEAIAVFLHTHTHTHTDGTNTYLPT